MDDQAPNPKSFDGVGDHILIGLRRTPVLDESDRVLLGELRPAGVILFKSNFRHDLPYEDWLESHARLIADIRAASGRDKLLIAIDHEGGRVCRTPPPITRFSYASDWAQQAAAVGQAMGRELASLGFNLSFAPVLDIHTNPNNPVIGPRAFGTTAKAVIDAALPFFKALESENVLACGKHFPGHGDTSVDSHLGLPAQSISLEELRARELKPFTAAMTAGLSMLMTAHILYPAIDPHLPATLSHRFLTGLVREELGFDGVTVTDDIGMGAMKGYFDDPSSAVRLLQAGCDMLMVSAHFTDSSRARGFAQAILDAQREGRLDPEQLARSRARIQKLLAKARTHEVRPLPSEEFRAHAKVAPLYEAATVEVV